MKKFIYVFGSFLIILTTIWYFAPENKIDDILKKQTLNTINNSKIKNNRSIASKIDQKNKINDQEKAEKSEEIIQPEEKIWIDSSLGTDQLSIKTLNQKTSFEMLSESKNEVLFESKIYWFTRKKVKLEDGNIYDLINVPGGIKVANTGEPSIPVLSREIAIPNDIDIEIQIENIEWMDLKQSFAIAPAQEPMPDSYLKKGFSYGFTRKFKKNKKTYSLNKFLNKSPVKINKILKIRRSRYARTHYKPFSYNPKTKKLRIAKKVRWKILKRKKARSFYRPYNRKSNSSNLFNSFFRKTKKLTNKVLSKTKVNILKGFNLLKPVSINKPTTIPSSFPSNIAQVNTSNTNINIPPPSDTKPGADYLIIVHDDLINSLEDFQEWKSQKGLKVVTVKTSEISSTNNKDQATSSEIYNYIKSAYDNWSPAPSYLLLVGDSELIPVSRTRVDNTIYDPQVPTDYKYSVMDGDDDYDPDIYMGRLPCNTTKECTNQISKILKYEKNPSLNKQYWNNVLLLSEFQDSKWIRRNKKWIEVEPDDVEERLFLETSQAYKSFLQSDYQINSVNIHRIFSSAQDAQERELKHNLNSIMHDNGVDYVTNPIFHNANDSVNLITNHINNGNWLVLHRDHGSYSSWGKPSFNKLNVDNLDNGEKQPLLLSINCRTGYFDQNVNNMGDGFAEHWMLKEDSGAVAAFAANRISQSWYNDWFAHGVLNCMNDGTFYSTIENIQGYKSKNYTVNPYTGTKLGQLLACGKKTVFNNYSSGTYTKRTAENFHLFGDPEMDVRNKMPFSLLKYNVIEGDNLIINFNNGIGTVKVKVDFNNVVPSNTQGWPGKDQALKKTSVSITPGFSPAKVNYSAMERYFGSVSSVDDSTLKATLNLSFHASDIMLLNNFNLMVYGFNQIPSYSQLDFSIKANTSDDLMYIKSKWISAWQDHGKNAYNSTQPCPNGLKSRKLMYEDSNNVIQVIYQCVN
jgi:hypothetical protein